MLKCTFGDFATPNTRKHTGTDAWFELSNEELLPDSMKGRAEEFHRMNDTLDVWFDSGTWCSSAKRENLNRPTLSCYHENVKYLTRVICVTHLYHKKISRTRTPKCIPSNITKTYLALRARTQVRAGAVSLDRDSGQIVLMFIWRDPINIVVGFNRLCSRVLQFKIVHPSRI